MADLDCYGALNISNSRWFERV